MVLLLLMRVADAVSALTRATHLHWSRTARSIYTSARAVCAICETSSSHEQGWASRITITRACCCLLLQESLTAIERCRWPVIAAIHGELSILAHRSATKRPCSDSTWPHL